MACSDWEESALLYCSDELDQDARVKFEAHVAGCESCRTFFEHYKKERVSMFIPDILGEVPSEKVSRELLRVCGSNRKQFTNVFMFSSVVKKSVLSVSFFLIGFIVIGYFIMNVNQIGQKQETITQTNDLNKSSTTVPSVRVATSSDQIESLNDSINNAPDSNRYFSKNRGNIDGKGVIPVDLINK